MKNCKKSKVCYYCERLHNSAICVQKKIKEGDCAKFADENKQNEKTKPFESSCHVQSNVWCVLLETAVVVVKNPKDSNELKTKVLFDNGSQRSYISNGVPNFFNLPSEFVENICISTLGNNKHLSDDCFFFFFHMILN